MTLLRCVCARCDFVDFVKEHHAVLLRSLQSLLRYCVLVNHLFSLLIDDKVHRLLDGEFSLLHGHFAHHTAEYASEVDFITGSVARLKLYWLWLLAYFHLDGYSVKVSRAYLLQKLLSELSVALFSCACGVFADRKENIAKFVLGNFCCSGHNFFEFFVSYEADRHFHEVADNAFDVSADIAHFRKFGCFHLYERCFDNLCETTCDFGLTYARRSFHNNIFRRDFFAHFLGKFASAIAIAKRDCHCHFCVVLTDDISIEFRDDLFRSHNVVIHSSPLRRSRP